MSNNLKLFNRYYFYVGWYRYSEGNKKAWIACAIACDGDIAPDAMFREFENLDAEGTEASWAVNFIRANADHYAWGETPSEAIQSVEAEIIEKLN